MIGLGTAFTIGLVASVSSCLAMVGGLVLALSAGRAQAGGSWRTHILFHLGRLGGFFLLGGAVGLLGSSLRLDAQASAVLGGFVALVMLVLGVGLLDLFPGVKKLQLRFPKCIGDAVKGWGTSDDSLAPLLLGVGTFFLPCGFTQSMQVAALATGDFFSGALLMFFFALGTFPMLAVLSFGSQSILQAPWRQTFFRVAGVGIIFLALFNLANAFSALGITLPRGEEQVSGAPTATLENGKQIVDLTVKNGYSPKAVTATAGVETVLRVVTRDTYDCSSSLVIPSLGYQKTLPSTGTEEIVIPAEKAVGTLRGTCAMGMYDFEIIFK